MTVLMFQSLHICRDIEINKINSLIFILNKYSRQLIVFFPAFTSNGKLNLSFGSHSSDLNSARINLERRRGETALCISHVSLDLAKYMNRQLPFAVFRRINGNTACGNRLGLRKRHVKFYRRGSARAENIPLIPGVSSAQLPSFQRWLKLGGGERYVFILEGAPENSVYAARASRNLERKQGRPIRILSNKLGKLSSSIISNCMGVTRNEKTYKLKRREEFSRIRDDVFHDKVLIACVIVTYYIIFIIIFGNVLHNGRIKSICFENRTLYRARITRDIILQ